MDRIVSPYFVIITALYLYTFFEVMLKLVLPGLTLGLELGFLIINLLLFVPLIMLILYTLDAKYGFLGNKETIFKYATLALMVLSGLFFQFIMLPLL